MYMIKKIIQSGPTFKIENENLRFLASREFLKSEFFIKNWSDRQKDAKLRMFQRSASRDPEHPNFKCLFTE
jgi:hypothetical protein